ncbi:DUF6527 family protein [Agromyces sp. GXQ0307]|uniref:DUF6527 family protein n=1 Tax=Agromyces sp. GXQ0307 TaxID=3377835 RepID=UPI00383BE90C
MRGRIPELRPEFVDTFPTELQPGIIYISIQYRTCGHLCCCGCGEEVITPLSPARWRFTYDGHAISLAPSVGNWSLPCQSHYWITAGRVIWAYAFTPEEIAAARAADRAAGDSVRSVAKTRHWWQRPLGINRHSR